MAGPVVAKSVAQVATEAATKVATTAANDPFFAARNVTSLPGVTASTAARGVSVLPEGLVGVPAANASSYAVGAEATLGRTVGRALPGVGLGVILATDVIVPAIDYLTGPKPGLMDRISPTDILPPKPPELKRVPETVEREGGVCGPNGRASWTETLSGGNLGSLKIQVARSGTCDEMNGVQQGGGGSQASSASNSGTVASRGGSPAAVPSTGVSRAGLDDPKEQLPKRGETIPADNPYGVNTQLPKEGLSVQHQDAIMGAALARVGSELKDPESFARGIIASDAGKLGSQSQLLTTPSPESDSLFNVLTGRDTSPAGQAMKELMKDAGFGDKTFLNPSLSNDQQRDAFSKNPMLVNYLHEAPGMMRSIEALNSGQSTPEQFKTEMSTNLFHNGPEEGFWKMFGGWTRGGLDKSGVSNFFSNTVFENGYPSPISFEGAMHCAFDRMDQGTGGGVQKILAELPEGMRGLSGVRELMQDNPERTLKQLSALNEHVDQMTTLTEAQRKTAHEVITERMERLQKYERFVDGNMSVERTPDGKVASMSFRHPHSSGDKAQDIVTTFRQDGDRFTVSRQQNGQDATVFESSDPGASKSFNDRLHRAAKRLTNDEGHENGDVFTGQKPARPQWK